MSSESGQNQPAAATAQVPTVEKNPSPAAETESLACPRCGSSNTKFCYYNNYNLCQPRHLCKSCRRHWTHGGALRKRKASATKRSRAAAEPDPNPKDSAPEPRSSTAADGGVEFERLSGFGFGPNGLGLGVWPVDNGGEAADDVSSSDWNTWQVSGSLADVGLFDVGDCFGWPELSISATTKKS